MLARRIEMTGTHHGSRRQPPPDKDDPAAAGTGGFLGQVGLFETANGLPHGPAAVALAVMTALVIYPVARILGALRRR
jgi:hypothetical protein